MQNLRKLSALIKTGKEPLIVEGNSLEFTLLNFWQWSASDILSNATRGRFAEFIVATAININVDLVRDKWSAYDLETPSGIKIEVKSAAYLQSWYQKSLSRINFSIKEAYCWDYEADKQSSIAKRSADVYVFCLLHHNDKETVNPLNLDQWEFYVVPTSDINRLFINRSSLSLKVLKDITKAVKYQELSKEINQHNQPIDL